MLQPFTVFILKLIRKNSLGACNYGLCFIFSVQFQARAQWLIQNKVNLGFLSQTVPKLCLRHLKVFTNRFYGL